MKLSKMLSTSRFLPTATVLFGLIALGLCDGGGGHGGGMSLGGMSLGSFDLGSLLSSLTGGGSKSMGAGFIKTKATIEESPEIGLGIHKVPIMLPLPTLILRKSKHLITKGMTMPLGCGGGGGGCGGGGGGGYGGGGYGGGMGGYGGGGYGGGMMMGGGGYGGGGGGYGGGGY